MSLNLREIEHIAISCLIVYIMIKVDTTVCKFSAASLVQAD